MYALALKIYKLKKTRPILYKVIDFMVSSVFLGIFVLLSLAVAYWATYNGYTTFDTALMGVALADIQIIVFITLIHGCR